MSIVYQRVPQVIQSARGDGLIAMRTDTENCFEFSPIAAEVWSNLEEPKSFEELRKALMAKYDVGRDQCTHDLLDLLSQLLSEELIVEAVAEPTGVSSCEWHSPRRATVSPAVAFDRLGPDPRLTPEFRLLVDCCQSGFLGNARPADLEIAAGFDWALFVRLARFHRVQGLVALALSPTKTIPADIARQLESDATDIAASNMRAIAGSLELHQAMDRAAIAHLFVKGLTLAVLAYGEATAKAAVDIDVLVGEDDVANAAVVLEACGYVPVVPDGTLSAARIRRWHRVHKESVWLQSTTGLPIDLHNRLADSQWLIPRIGLGSPQQQVEVAEGIQLPTLAPDELFAYLAVHGAYTSWFRLKWISDFAALISTISAVEVEKAYRRSLQLGAGRCGAQALLLADALFGSLEALPTLRQELEGSRANRRLLAAALRRLAGRHEPTEPTEVRFGTLTLHVNQFRLLSGARYKLSELVRQVRTALAR